METPNHLARPIKQCRVCGEDGDGAHFGTEACRACAAFFRRSVVMDKVYVCRSNGQCTIETNIRCLCRACRFKKCIVVGMRKSAVQRHREKRKIEKMNQLTPEWKMNSMSMSSLSPTSSSSLSEIGFNLLQKMRTNYLRMEELRDILHNRQGNLIYMPQRPKPITYLEANNIHIKEIGIVSEWMSKSFEKFNEFPQDQKRYLYRNFYLSFFILECGLRCVKNCRNDLLFFPNGDYVDLNHPEQFYSNINPTKLISMEEAIKMFQPSFDIYRRNVLEPMQRESFDEYEFYTLCGLVLWDYGMEGQNQQSRKIAKLYRDNLLRGILHYYRNIKFLSDSSMRVSQLVMLLPALQRSVRRFQEDVEITHVFGVFSIDPKFYELVSGRLDENIFEEHEKPVKTEEIDDYSFWNMDNSKYSGTPQAMCYSEFVDSPNLPSTSSSASSVSFEHWK